MLQDHERECNGKETKSLIGRRFQKKLLVHRVTEKLDYRDFSQELSSSGTLQLRLCHMNFFIWKLKMILLSAWDTFKDPKSWKITLEQYVLLIIHTTLWPNIPSLQAPLVSFIEQVSWNITASFWHGFCICLLKLVVWNNKYRLDFLSASLQ